MIFSFFHRSLLFLLLWVLLSEALGRDPVIAGLGIAAATLFSLYMWPRRSLKLRWTALPALTWYFLRSSLKGGIDISCRALAPSMPLHPDRIGIECRLPSEAGLVLFTWMISLMPGTACINLKEGNHLIIHVVDSRMYAEQDLRDLEEKISRFIKSSPIEQ
jgi:multicomponent Na+:H+ antiporter subunit E